MADFLVEPVIEKLIDFGFEYLKDQVRWQTGMKDELESLRQKLPQVQAVVNYASSQEQIKDPALNEWLWQLRAAVDEADDVMDEFEYLKLKKQLLKTKKQRKVRSTMKYVNEKLVEVVKRALKIDPTLKRLEEVVHKLDEVSAGVASFLHLVDKAEQEHLKQQIEQYTTRETGSLPKNDQIGRGDEKEYVMKWLRETSNEDQTTSLHMHSNISILSIVGQGGMGKTTLLQHVYKEVKIDESDEKEFDLKIWVCVSNNFNATKVIADMLEYATKVRPSSVRLAALQETLKSTVNSRKFLLVLDDIWEEDEDKIKWENVLAPLASGKLGSKILISTRMQSVALMLSKVIHKKEEILPLEGLKYDECLQLFCASTNVGNLNDHPNLISIAEKIVGKLYGSPLAARVIGGVIDSSLDEGLWRKVLDYHIGSQNDILRVLKLSYLFLPKVLRKCLSFCCTFPPDYVFRKDHLVQMWIALNFIQPPSNQGETIQDLGERYLDILVKKNLIDEFQTSFGLEYYKLHDLIHDILRVVSAQECFSIVGDTASDENLLLRNSKTIRHLFVKTSNIDVLRKVEEFKNLRSLHLFYHKISEDDVDVLAKIFKTLRSIRLIHIDAIKLKRMPKEIGDLIHLRDLSIFGDYLNHTFIQLPKYMNNLLSLHYLAVPFPGIYEIGKLNSLKELNSFYVQNKDGYRIEELQHMNELRVLRIEFRENLKDAKDAYSAKLCDKRNLIDLSLGWDEDTSDAVVGLHENVLDNLQPHSNLKKLCITYFKGVRPAIWMNNVDLISNLEHIELRLCEGLQTLPPFWQLPLLKYLYLCNMKKVKGFEYTYHGNDKVRVFPSLQVLYISELEAFEDWFVATSAACECLFPCLTELSLLNCPNLLESPALPPTLEKLEICDIVWIGSNWLQGIHNYCNISIKDCPNLISLKGHQEMKTAEKCQLILSELTINDPSLLIMAPLTNVTSIEKLKIKDNEALISFPMEAEEWFLQVSSSLYDLEFYSLKSLLYLPSSLEKLSSLKILYVKDVPLLQLLPNMHASLEQLELVKLESLQFLPSSLENLSSLRILSVENVPQLQLLPNMPTSLKELTLATLNSLQCLPSALSFSSLKSLYLRSIPLQELPDLPTSLRVLYLSYLSNLHCLPSFLPYLKKLGLNYLPQLQELPNLPPSLCELYLTGSAKLPSCLPNLSSLQTLDIWFYPQLRELPDLPPSLNSLSIQGCHPELKKRYQRDTGSDWHKIAHIPDVDISD